jgi:hemolysin III
MATTTSQSANAEAANRAVSIQNVAGKGKESFIGRTIIFASSMITPDETDSQARSLPISSRPDAPRPRLFSGTGRRSIMSACPALNRPPMTERIVRTTAQARRLREEIASAAIQGSAAAASAAGSVYLVTRAGPRQDALGLGAVIVYGAAMVIAFLASALYHGVQQKRIKPILQEIDHCTIFVFIAGTYTPVTMLALRHHAGATLLAAIWGLAAAGVVLRLRYGRIYRRVAVPLYLVMGWLFLLWTRPLYHEVGAVPILLIVAGGLSYSGGLLFYRWHSLPFSNPLWHLCVVAGSAWFFVAIARLLSVAG